MKAMLEKNIANFTGNTVKEIIFGAEALKLANVHFNFAGITRLQEAGVLFAKGVGYDGKTVGYVVFYDGEVIAQGSAKEIREALKDLWKAEKSELKTKLSGLFRNKIFTKYATKFEKKFHLHFDGEILIKEKGQEEILELFGAHNHDLIGTKIQIGAIRKPPGIKSIHDLPNDVPFKANVEMKYNASVVKKKNTSSFFPKNWDIKRVKEEIALLYDEMLKSGKELKFKNNTYRSMDSTNSFQIQIEFDELGNLTSAYPIVN